MAEAFDHAHNPLSDWCQSVLGLGLTMDCATLTEAIDRMALAGIGGRYEILDSLRQVAQFSPEQSSRTSIYEPSISEALRGYKPTLRRPAPVVTHQAPGAWMRTKRR